MAAWREFVQVAKPYWLGDQRKVAWTLLALLIVLMLAETQFAVMLNDTVRRDDLGACSARRRSLLGIGARCLGILAFAVPIYAFYYYMRDVLPTTGGAG